MYEQICEQYEIIVFPWFTLQRNKYSKINEDEDLKHGQWRG